MITIGYTEAGEKARSWLESAAEFQESLFRLNWGNLDDEARLQYC